MAALLLALTLLLALGVIVPGVVVARKARRPLRVAGRSPATGEAEQGEDVGALVRQAQAEARARRQAADEELAARREAVDAAEARLVERDREVRERRERLDRRTETVEEQRARVEAERSELAGRRDEVGRSLELAAGTDRAAAAEAVLARVDAELTADHGGRVARAVAARVGEAAPAARYRLADAIERQDIGHTDSAPRLSPIVLEGLDDEARERLLTALSVIAGDTATDLGVDAERDQATLRGLDPVGREVARQASLEVLDRRLQAVDVPPLLDRTRRALAHHIRDIGERALWEMQMEGRPELAELMGTLHYRFSYGQNALLHCQETGYLCAVLAGELQLDETAARTAGVLHDIGKAVDHDVEGSHAIIGGEILAVLGVEPGIVHAVKAHHFDEEPSTDLAMLTICADAISASRPGARRDTLTTYLQRLEQLQQIATRHRGVERAFPMQAGREVRVSVRPEQVPDARVPDLCAEIAREIESEMTYPGVIKVTVIRETNASATAN